MKTYLNMMLSGILSVTLVLISFGTSACTNPPENKTIKDLEKWLSQPEQARSNLHSEEFANIALSNAESEEVLEMLIKHKQTSMLNQYSTQWNNRILKYKKYEMPFYYNIFGEKPADGRSLYISLHGGGGTTPQANDKQYKNQQHLYDATMKDLEGVYLAPRSTTNSWNMWHQDHIDEFLNIIIQMAVIKEGVNPNKVYLLGYSAGGDGLYQLAPRMADRWAAASMMAGHPGDASPLNMKNTPFAIHMGELDGAYDRNKHAAEWGEVLDSLESTNPSFYIHQVQVHKDLGHWMKLKDAVALPWMSEFTRNPIPNNIVWRQDDCLKSIFSWISTPTSQFQKYGKVIASYNTAKNEIIIEQCDSDSLIIQVNDKMLDLDKEIVVKYNEKIIYKNTAKRTTYNIYKSIMNKGDENLSFPAVIAVAIK